MISKKNINRILLLVFSLDGELILFLICILLLIRFIYSNKKRY